MKIVTITCPSWSTPLPARLPVRPVSQPPDRAEVDPLLAEADRVLVAGQDADLAAVVLRLLRTDRLAAVEVAYLPAIPNSAAAQVWGLPTNPASALALALQGSGEPVPLIRDDAGGVLVGRGELRGVRGEAYCDAELVLRGQASKFVVTPLAPIGVDVRVTSTGLTRRTRAAHGRAIQIGCVSATVVSDGVEHPRPVTRWTWYRHTQDLRMIRTARPVP